MVRHEVENNTNTSIYLSKNLSKSTKSRQCSAQKNTAIYFPVEFIYKSLYENNYLTAVGNKKRSYQQQNQGNMRYNYHLFMGE